MKTDYRLGYIVFLSLVAAIGGILFGYDTAVISGTIDQVADEFHLTVMEQGWFVGCALIGSIVGVAFTGILSDRLGRRFTMFIAAFLFTASGIWCSFSCNFCVLVLARFIGGLGIGNISIVAPMYISEIAVTKYRGRLVSLYQLAITLGFLAAYLTNYMLLNISKTASFSSDFFQQIFVDDVWRSMFGMEAIPAFIFFIILFFIPESPRWLIMHHRENKASEIYSHIYTSHAEARRQIEDTESTLSSKSESEWRTLFEPGIFKSVIVGLCIAMLGQFMGVNAVLYYGPSIFKDAGISNPLFCQVLVGIVNTVGTIIAMFIIDKFGRKKLIYYGVTGMIIDLLCIAFYFIEKTPLNLSTYIMPVFFLLYVFCCAVSISAVVWVLLSEMYPNRIRGLAMSIAGFALWIGTYLIGQLTPWLLQNLTPAGTFILFAVMCIPYLLIMWKMIPETAGMSLEEIERYWTKGK
ncbi:MAG: sugar porter family MFS transporter [Prevotella sp.]|jgi:sugar porter (SP) family MFS transporter|nr:sugar porter family MFS transporter [Prevotella sp.]MCH3995168.1 sugar porter family MFS transporter [Prevotella sp.]MCI1247203.1 sugar porter family MFS transporter [Prevotella sp.]